MKQTSNQKIKQTRLMGHQKLCDPFGLLDALRALKTDSYTDSGYKLGLSVSRHA